MKNLKRWLIGLCLLLVVGADDCNETASDVDDVQTDQVAELAAEAQRQLGMPNITNFTERRFMKQIMELRDQETTTHTYVIDMTGDLHYLCQSIGYGLPYSTQYTNPERIERHYNGASPIPQPDPNGLFMPDGMAATWVLCLDESDGDIDPLYIEPEILVTPFRLNAEGGDYFLAEEQAAQETAGIK